MLGRSDENTLKSRRVVVALAMAVVAVGCGKAAVTPSTVPPALPVTARITSVKIVPETTTIRVGVVAQFSYVVTMSDGLPPTVPPPLWSMSDSAVAQVDFGGRVTAVSPGTTTLSIAFTGQRDTRVLQIVP